MTSKKILLAGFVLALAANIAAAALKNDLLNYISKPLIIVTLAGYFYSSTASVPSPLKKWILLALLFSWAGDVLLLFRAPYPRFFLFGLSAFLLAHICYIVFFHVARIRERIKGNPWLLVIVLVYYGGLITLLSPHLGDMKLPVRVYGIVISFMFMLAMHMLYLKDQAAGRLMMSGALLFVLSDSILAVNEFYQTLPLAGVWIMLTYGLAQYLIVEGTARYITSARKE